MTVRRCSIALFSLLSISLLCAQPTVLLQPADAVHLAEISKLFQDHHAEGGCPSAEASLETSTGIIHLRVRDGCLEGVSTFAGDYQMNAKTGEVRDHIGHLIIAKNDPALILLWQEVRASLLTDKEASCLVAQTSRYQEWIQRGLRIKERLFPAADILSVELFPTAAKPVAPERQLQFRVDRRDYRVFEGRFLKEDTSNGVVSMRRLLSIAKGPIEIGRDEVLEGVKHMPAVAIWLRGSQCRGIRLDGDLEGMTYYSVDLFQWCPSDSHSQSEAGFSVDKRSGKILSVQGIALGSTNLPDATSQLAALGAFKASADNHLSERCRTGNGQQ
jgi:hypothetical protein